MKHLTIKEKEAEVFSKMKDVFGITEKKISGKSSLRPGQ